MLLAQLTADATTCKLVKTDPALSASCTASDAKLSKYLSLSQAGALFVFDVGVELVLLELLAENAVWCGAVRCAHESTFCDYAMRIRCNLTGI